MPLCRVAALALCLGASTPRGATAQTWAGDSSSTRLNWQSVDVLVYPDTSHGVFVWALTPQLGPWEKHRSASSFLDPADLDPWLEKAAAVVMTSAPPPNDTVTALMTPKLQGSCGQDIVILRRRTRHNWSSDVDIIFSVPGGTKPWTVVADRGQAKDFLQALSLQSARSRVRPVEPAAGALVDGSRIDSPPRLLPGQPYVPLPRGPVHYQGSQHEIALLFIIRADGTPDPDSFHAALYDDPGDVELAVAAFRKFRFQPGMVNGQPVDTFISTEVQY